MRYTLPLLVLLTLLLSACSVIKAIDPALPTATSPAPATETAAFPEATASPQAAASLEATATPEAAISTAAPDPSVTPPQPTSASNPPAEQNLARTDGQGAVEVEVTPSNLTNPGETLDFEVGLNTHSVNLNMDLATLATLKTDTGFSVNASSWSGES